MSISVIPYMQSDILSVLADNNLLRETQGVYRIFFLTGMCDAGLLFNSFVPVATRYCFDMFNNRYFQACVSIKRGQNFQNRHLASYSSHPCENEIQIFHIKSTTIQPLRQ